MARSMNNLGQQVPVYAAPKSYNLIARSLHKMNAATNKMVDLIAVWNKRSAYRHELAMLPRELLADIGLDAATARHEANKPFWKK